MKFLSFVPGYIVPPLVSLLFVYTFTHRLAPADYGIYAVVVSMVQLANASLFSWLQLTVKRFYAEAAEQGWAGRLTMAIYTGYAGAALLAVVAFLIFLFTAAPEENVRSVYWFGLGLVLVRAFGVIIKAYRVGRLDGWRYGAMESSESVVGFLAALTLVYVLGWRADGLIVGVLVGALMPTLIDMRILTTRLREAAWDPATLQQMFRFGTPFMLGYALDYILSSSDRLLVQHFLGDAAVGIYAVSYTLADRAVSAPFQAIALVTYPLLMRALADSGLEGARRQAHDNLQILLLVTVPALAGLAVGAPQIAEVMLGPEFSAPAAALVPWIAMGVFLSGLRLHYFDQALHLVKKTNLVLFAALPPAVLNVALNIVLLPRMGLEGAVVATIAAYVLAFMISVGLMYRYCRLPVAPVTMGKVAVAVVTMTAVLHLARFPANLIGLAGLVVSGVVVYGSLVFALNIAGMRDEVMRRVARRDSTPTKPGT